MPRLLHESFVLEPRIHIHNVGPIAFRQVMAYASNILAGKPAEDWSYAW
jgi:hypothetical protein